MSFNKQQKQLTLLSKLKKISLGKRALIYLFFMGIVGAILGNVESQVTLKKCASSDNCTIENPAEMKINQTSIGACAGMLAATLLSLPAMLDEEN